MIDISRLEDAVVMLINLVGLLLIFQVYRSDKNERINHWFILMTLFDVMWVDFSFLGNREMDALWATAYTRINSGFVALFMIALYYFFGLYYLEENGKHYWHEKIVPIAGVFFAIASFATDWIIKSSTHEDWYVEINFGALNDYFYLYSVLVVVLVLIYTVKKYPNFYEAKRKKIQYLLIGVSIFALLNVIFNIILPILIGSTAYARFGDYSAMALLVFTAYPMTKNNLTGVRTFLVKIIIALMAIILGIDALFLTDSLNARLLEIIILITFLYFGRELVRNMTKEEKDSEEVRKINLDLAKRNKDLRIVFDASNKVSQEFDSKKISQNVVNSVPTDLKYLGFNFGVIFLYSIKHDCAYAYAVTDSWIKEKIEKETSVSILKFREYLTINDDLIIKTIKNKRMYASNKLEDFFGNFVEQKKNIMMQNILRARSFISVPLFSSGQVIGAIILTNMKGADEITEGGKNIIKAFASHVGPAIENARLYEKSDSQIKELAKLNRNLKKSHGKLEELLAMKSEFLHITSHQLRTPLTAIRGMISMWLDGDFDNLPPEKKNEMLRRIYVSTERLNNVTNDMLDALELEGGALTITFKKINIVEMIKDTIATLQPNYDKKGLYLRFGHIDKNVPEVDAEPNYMGQVFMNLIDNACKYTRTGGVEIDVKQNKEFVEVYIKDTGIGISEKDQGRIFEKFTRGENAMAENASGSGLGLFIVKKILDEHNGEIEVKSEGKDKGAVFKISLLIDQG